MFQSLDGLAHRGLADGKLRRRRCDAALPGNVVKNFIIFEIDIQKTPAFSSNVDLCFDSQKFFVGIQHRIYDIFQEVVHLERSTAYISCRIHGLLEVFQA